MGQYDQLFQTLDTLKAQTARFRRVALHVHSPESYDWSQKACDKVLNDKAKLIESGGQNAFTERLKSAFDLVAITDHMKCSYASSVSLATQRGCDFLVLPGMEVSFQPEAALGVQQLHILVILPEGTSPERAGRLFAGEKSMPDEKDRKGQEILTGRLDTFVEAVHREGGLCIHCPH